MPSGLWLKSYRPVSCACEVGEFHIPFCHLFTGSVFDKVAFQHRVVKVKIRFREDPAFKKVARKAVAYAAYGHCLEAKIVSLDNCGRGDEAIDDVAIAVCA